MDILKMLVELREERAQIETAIMTIERLAAGHGKRRGRPPAWMAASQALRGVVVRQVARTNPQKLRRLHNLVAALGAGPHHHYEIRKPVPSPATYPAHLPLAEAGA